MWSRMSQLYVHILLFIKNFHEHISQNIYIRFLMHKSLDTCDWHDNMAELEMKKNTHTHFEHIMQSIAKTAY